MWSSNLLDSEAGNADSYVGIHNGGVLLWRNELREAPCYEGPGGDVHPQALWEQCHWRCHRHAWRPRDAV